MKIRIHSRQTAHALESIHATAQYFHDVLEDDVVELKFCQFAKVSRLTFGVLQHWDLLTVVEKMDLTKKQVMEILSHDADQILELSGDSGISTSFTSYALVSDQLGDDIVHELDDDLEIIVNRLTGQSSDLDIVTITVMDNSWKLLRDKVFGTEHDHPHELEEIGKRIAEKYQSRSLTILVIAGYPSKLARTLKLGIDKEMDLGPSSTKLAQEAQLALARGPGAQSRDVPGSNTMSRKWTLGLNQPQKLAQEQNFGLSIFNETLYRPRRFTNTINHLNHYHESNSTSRASDVDIGPSDKPKLKPDPGPTT
ncbi:hypothetical protein BC332_12611 [Capsicum chinense]|nr:hypothetical protein BC332_12611 [Capsicum chinense]